MFLATLVVAAAGCGGGGGPVEDYRAYLGALAAARYEEAFGYVAAESVAALEKRRTAAGGPASSDRENVADRVVGCPDAFTAFRALMSSGAPAYLPAITPEAAEKAVPTVVSLDGTTAEIEVPTPAGPSRVALRRESGRWKVRIAGL